MTPSLGLFSRTGSAAAVAIDGSALVGRWELDLTEGRVPAQIWHAASEAALPNAEAMVRQAVDIVAGVATRRVGELLAEVGGVATVGVVVGDYPVPDSVSAILASHTLMHAAEGQLYRDALLEAVAALGRHGIGLPRRQAQARLTGDLAEIIATMGRASGPPWRKEYKLAAVAALTAAPFVR
jgi:hypothetical protein